jgi:outer membrane protein assembly factor BamB
MYSSPAFDSSGTVYIGSYDGILYAIKSNGKKKWKYTASFNPIFSSPVIGSDGTLYIGSFDGKLYAVH